MISTLTTPTHTTTSVVTNGTARSAFTAVPVHTSNGALDAFVPSSASPASDATLSVAQRGAGRIGAYAANAGLSLVGGLAGGIGLGLGLGLITNPSALGTFARLGVLGGSVFGSVGGIIGSSVKAHQTGDAFQPGHALGVGAAAGAGGTIVAFVGVILALGAMS